ncbi:uncharacterized protein LOC135812578 [Sycon ciliatum]|uniref:uncharacterized protein LOC135812578 n=1 Tax=Sycon ciliatum TaxID=27933 RepID=UPI0031F71C40
MKHCLSSTVSVFLYWTLLKLEEVSAQDPPSPLVVDAYEESALIIACPAPPSTPANNIMWYGRNNTKKGTGPIMVVSSLEAEHADVYWCFWETPGGENFSAAAQLVVTPYVSYKWGSAITSLLLCLISMSVIFAWGLIKQYYQARTLMRQVSTLPQPSPRRRKFSYFGETSIIRRSSQADPEAPTASLTAAGVRRVTFQPRRVYNDVLAV